MRNRCSEPCKLRLARKFGQKDSHPIFKLPRLPKMRWLTSSLKMIMSITAGNSKMTAFKLNQQSSEDVIRWTQAKLQKLVMRVGTKVESKDKEGSREQELNLSPSCSSGCSQCSRRQWRVKRSSKQWDMIAVAPPTSKCKMLQPTAKPLRRYRETGKNKDFASCK